MKTVMYLGERVTFLGKVYQVFKDKKGESFSYTQIKNVWVGDCYEITNDGKMSRRPSSVTGWEMTEKEKLESEAQKVAVRAHRLQQRKAMQLKKPHPNIVSAIKLLRPFFRSMGRIDQERFTAYLTNEMSKGVNK